MQRCVTQKRKARTASRSSWPSAASRTRSSLPRSPHNMPQETTASPIGRDTPRVDGPLKVTGTAQYASDFHFPGLLYAVPVEATIAKGKVVNLDTAAAGKMPGVRAIFHREN